ncbi:MAG: glycine cleavage system aminomethyltransferase GcvT [Acidobacteria bacterium]|nr:glycine cleavage system aminomethyltransferase GcvT [Acidobacteriota bacterium]
MDDALLKTPLNEVHRASGARMVDFGGWDMPVQYPAGIAAEHMAVRTGVGLFDVSHMGEIEVTGPQALDLLEKVTCNRVANLQDGQAHYTGLLNEQGGFIDDLLVHRVGEGHYFLCVNASNQDKDYAHIAAQAEGDVKVDFVSKSWAQIAVQGPKAVATVQKLTDANLEAIQYYWFSQGVVAGVPGILARTGYTGEDGFELYVPASAAVEAWNAVLEAGKDAGILPCGLGARNTLRLEAAMALHGHEISETITPLEAGLAWIVKLDKGDFIGRDALVRQKEQGAPRKLIGFEMRDRGIGRDGYPVVVGDKQAGVVTSGGPSPYLGTNIGMALVEQPAPGIGEPIGIEIRGKKTAAEVVKRPFYKRDRA